MKYRRFKRAVAFFCAVAMALSLAVAAPVAAAQERRNEVSFLRGTYNTAYYKRHTKSERYSAGFHFNHGKMHDLMQLTPLSRAAEADAKFDHDSFEYVHDRKARVGPSMEFFGPYVARMAWDVYRTIDWTHMHHEQTYDIMASTNVAWDKKKAYTDRAVEYYLKEMPDVARSIAPLDITMRRAAVMMKPYFTYERTYYPKSALFTYVAHWWHPAAYESLMLAGNGRAQEELTNAMNDTMFREVFVDRPQRMLLSREAMPRYSKMSPESANIFDNLHMLHGIVYDIFAYPKWTPAQKKAELYRVIKAMSYQPGDEKYVRKFKTPYPDLDPRVYYDWMKKPEGEMSRIMMEMMMEMLPMMMPDSMPVSDEVKQAMMLGDMDKAMSLMSPEMRQMHERMMRQFKMKMRVGLEPGEVPGSLHDAMMSLMPNMKMMPGSMEPGRTPQMMVDVMLKGWQEKYGGMPDIEGYDMSREPVSAPPLPAMTAQRR